jgi:phage terminase large subunit
MSERIITANIPDSFEFLFEPHRYKSARGGRGGAKSYAFADALLIQGVEQPLRILCARELQCSIAESVHHLLEQRINTLGFKDDYSITKSSITGLNGTEFIFKGIRFNINEIKSMEGIDICWVEEAQSVSDDSWKVLIPTIRKEDSEIWLSWNTGKVEDPTYQRFVAKPPEDCISKLINYWDNPYFPNTLRKEMEYCKLVDYQAYLHIWEGQPKKISDAVVFKDKFVVEDFETPVSVKKFRYGGDWGFATDPTVLVRSFIIDNELYIDQEAWGVGVEFEQIPELFDTVDGSRDNKIIADSARPETISYVRRQGFAIVACKKFKKGTKLGFVKDGVEFIRKFKKIHIHTRCKNTKDEFENYSYKVDKTSIDPKTNQPRILPLLEDSFNHIIDALRYSLEDLIKGGTNWAAVIGEE